MAMISGPSTVCVDEIETFTALDNGPGATYSWDFGPNANPQFASTPTVDVVWSSFGIVNITLEVTNNGCTSYAFESIAVSNSPVVCGTLFAIQGDWMSDGTVALNWSMADMENGHLFEIQHSANNQSFEPIGTIDYEAGRSDYQFVDIHPQTGMNYYRVKLMDASGEYIFSNVVEFENETSTGFGVYPNPVQEILTIDIPSSTSSTTIRIYSILGQLVYEQTLEMSTSQLEVPMMDFNAGTYFVQLNQGDEPGKVQKIFKD